MSCSHWEPAQRSSISVPLIDEEDERLEKKLKMQVLRQHM
jgi:hypothetical protein